MSLKIYDPKAKVRANEIWIDTDGIEYVIFSVKTIRSLMEREVTAYTFDVMNGEGCKSIVNGKRVCMIHVEEWNFITGFHKA